MKIGILDESIIRKIAGEILINRPEVINVFVEGTELNIESDNIDSLAQYLEKEHGLHLIVNGNNYLVASEINEANEATAGHLAAKAASKAAKASGAASAVAEKAANNQTEDEETEAQEAQDTKEEAEDAIEKGNAGEEFEDAVRMLGTLAKKVSPQQIEKALQKPEIGQMAREMAKSSKNDDIFARLDGKLTPKRELEEE